MIQKEKVINLVKEAIEENPALFLIDLKFLPENKISVEVDGDTGVTLKECIRISRGIEQNLDREIEDFSFFFASPNIANPLKVYRQYKKNINRVLTLKLKDNTTIEGVLKNVTDNEIELEWKTREPKSLGKGKITVIKNSTIPFSNILEAKVKIIF